MNFFKNFSNIRGLLLFVAVGLLTTTLPAQTVVENTGESSTTEGRRDDTTAKDAKEKEAEIKKEAAKIKKQAEPKPPRFGGHVGIVIPLIARGNDDDCRRFRHRLSRRSHRQNEQSARFRFRVRPDDKHAVESGFQISRSSGRRLWL